jgi:hypothetical protein
MNSQRQKKCFFTVGLLVGMLLFTSGGGNIDAFAFIPANGVASMVADACVFIPASLVAILASSGGVSAGPPNMEHIRDLNGSKVK